MATLKLEGKKKILLYAGLGISVAALLSYFIFSVLGKRIKELNQQIKLSEAKLRDIMGIQKQKDAVAAECERYQPYLEAASWDDRRIVEELLKEVERIAKDSRVSVINLSPEPGVEQGKGYKKYKVNLRVDADLEQLLALLNRIAENKFLIKVDRLSVLPKGETAEVLKVETTIAMVIP